MGKSLPIFNGSSLGGALGSFQQQVTNFFTPTPRGDGPYDGRTVDDFKPYLVALNLTKRCNLKCDHCAKIKPEEFQKRFIEGVRAIEKLTAGQVIAVDGKKLRRSHDQEAGKEAIYMVSAWATQNQLVLGQTKVADKSNEITAIPELLRLLDLTRVYCHN